MQKNVFDARIAMDKAASKRTVLPVPDASRIP